MKKLEMRSPGRREEDLDYQSVLAIAARSDEVIAEMEIILARLAAINN